jgi:hypothetical protein
MNPTFKDRDFLRYDIWKYNRDTRQYIFMASTTADGYTDVTEYIIGGGDGPDWNRYYYAFQVDQSQLSSLSSNNAYYMCAPAPACDGCEGDNFSNSPIPKTQVPKEYTLTNFPNPFNPSTTIYYALPVAANVRITVYDLLGRLVKELVNAHKEAGMYVIEFNGSELSAGIYLYRIEAGSFVQTKRMILLK